MTDGASTERTVMVHASNKVIKKRALWRKRYFPTLEITFVFLDWHIM